MPFASIAGAKKRRFPTKINDVPLTLSQINHLAEMFESLEKEKKVKTPMAVAITTFKKEFMVKEGKWVKRKKDENDTLLDVPDRTGFDIISFEGKFKIMNRDPWQLVMTVPTEEEAKEKIKELVAEAKKAQKMDDRVMRFDFARISEKHIDDSTGFLTIPAAVTRTGIFIYKKEDGSEFRELRTSDEVFKKDSMDTLKNKPVTNGHPSEMVTLDNAKRYMVGHTNDRADRNGILLETDITITDKQSIEQVDSGKKFLSCGYLCKLDHTPGVFKGEKYDAVQENISYNHIAIVNSPRAGEQAQMHLDDADAIMVIDLDKLDNKKQGGTMKKLKIDGKEIEVSDEVYAAFEKAGQLQTVTQKKLDDEVAAHKTDTDAKEKLQAKSDATEKENKDLKEKIGAGDNKDQVKKDARERIEVLKVAEKVCDEETVKKFDEMDNLEIKKTTLVADDKDLDLKDKTDEYINARFDILKERISKTDGTDGLGKSILHNREDGKIPDASKARFESMKHDSELWKQPLSSSNVKQ